MTCPSSAAFAPIVLAGCAALASFAVPLAVRAQSAACWVATYHGTGSANHSAWPVGAKVDSRGNLVLALISPSRDNGTDFVTIKFGPRGQVAWVARYDGPLHLNDRPSAVIIGPSDSIYVGGESFNGPNGFTIVKYSTDGIERWVRHRLGGGPIAMAPGVDDGVYAAAGGVIRYDADGNEVWYGYPTAPGVLPAALAVDTTGAAYLTGYVGPTSFSDIVTVTFSPTGEELWTRQFNGAGNGRDEAVCIGIGNDGAVYVAGSTIDEQGRERLILIKYDTDGALLWSRRHDDPPNASSQANALAVDGAGDICVTGRVSSNYLTIKYDGAGNQQWVRTYTTPPTGPLGTSNDEAIGVATDTDNSVYVVGEDARYTADQHMTTIKYSPNGSVLWTQRYGPIVYASGIAVDPAGYPYVFGQLDNVAVVVKYASAPPCYANCDDTICPPILDVNDFVCFLRRFAAADPAANCDGSTMPPVLNVDDFSCFQQRFAAGCP